MFSSLFADRVSPFRESSVSQVLDERLCFCEAVAHTCGRLRLVVLLATVLATVIAMSGGPLRAQIPQNKQSRWEANIRRFEQDRQKFPPKGGILFIGSSSIVGWKLDEYFPDLPVINRGFGGSQIVRLGRFRRADSFSVRAKTHRFLRGRQRRCRREEAQPGLGRLQAVRRKSTQGVAQDADRLRGHQAEYQPMEFGR